VRTLSCSEARDLASDLLDGDLEPDEVAAVEAHVAGCATCPNLYLAMVAIHRHFARERQPEPDLEVESEREG
jgi:predicted anti-sigma-YlaC factor YlaD